ncbi:MAG: DUF2971 domain-containing protein [Pelobacteraceae bacterium]
MKKLYRYRSVTDMSIAGIEANEFFFASPSGFNDPFDCKNLFTFHGARNSDWRIFLSNYLINKEPHLTEQERKQAVEKVIRAGEHRSREKITEQGAIWSEILEKQSRRLGIVCLSEKPDDILMWAHYGDSHRGFCLEFDSDVLKKSYYCSRVRYRKEYPTFTEFVRSDLEEMARTFVLTKSNHWKYEKEVRLLRNAETEDGRDLGRVVKYPLESLTGIIFGCSISDAYKARVEESVRKNGANVTFSQCIKSGNSYSVKIVAT